jgi:hypothetical protein
MLLGKSANQIEIKMNNSVKKKKNDISFKLLLAVSILFTFFSCEKEDYLERHYLPRGYKDTLVLYDTLITHDTIVQRDTILNLDTVVVHDTVLLKYFKVPRYIAHAGGGIDGYTYTNSLEALNYSYDLGFRSFEIDLVEDKNGKILGAHDWEHWAQLTGCDSTLPVTEEHFLTHQVFDKFTPMSMDMINQWFAEHPDAILVTDKINSPKKMASQFVDKSRLMMELFSFDAIEEAKECGVEFMMSENLLPQIKEGNRLQYILDNDIKYLAISRSSIEKYKDLLMQIRKYGIKVFVFHINFVEGKDEEYVYYNELQYVYGMYADKWIDEFAIIE